MCTCNITIFGEIFSRDLTAIFETIPNGKGFDIVLDKDFEKLLSADERQYVINKICSRLHDAIYDKEHF